MACGKDLRGKKTIPLQHRQHSTYRDRITKVFLTRKESAKYLLPVL